MGMKSTEESVALQAIEFWTAVAEDEANMESEWQEAQDVERPHFFSQFLY